MERYNDTDALKEQMCHEAFEKTTDMQRLDSGCWFRYKMSENVIASIPTADVVERKKGKWLNKFVYGLGFSGLEFECSECGKRSAGRTNYCAYCGAEMCK